MGRLIIVSNRLPISVKKVDGKLEYSPSIGGLATALSSYVEGGDNKWIGWPGIVSEELDDAERASVTKHLQKQNCYPIFLTQAEVDGFYNGYSNGVLWPIFHHLPLESGDTAENWEAYRAVNKRFADETLALSRASDNIWIHDYQLLLTPEMLRIARPKQHIGFFLHIPWPSYEDLSQTPYGVKLIQGTLGADVVGMHTSAYTENFLRCCQKESIGVVGSHKVALPNRVVRVTDFPIGINYQKFADAAKSSAVALEHRKLRWKYRGKKVILTIDRLDPSKGLVERLEAYKTLLKENSDLHTKVVLVMQAMPSRTDVPAYQRLREQVDELIADINSMYGHSNWQPIEAIFSPLPFASYAALYQRADVAFITPIRDGMNLVAKEYLASHPKSDGILVLSETAGAAEELRDAILVNPNRPRSLVHGLRRALTVKPEALRERTVKMQKHLSRHTVDKWAASFITTLEKPVAMPIHLTRSLSKTAEHALIANYHRAIKRLILLDYDGTLTPLVRNPADAKPSANLLRTLTRLAADSHNEVVIISGRSRQTLQEWFGDTPVTLIAEHGAFIKKPSWKTWHTMLLVDTDWKAEVTAIFDYYADLTPGASVENKEHSVVWHYRNASPYYAQKNLVAIKRLIKPLTTEHKLSMQEGKKVLDVRHLDVSKGHALQEWLLKDQDFVMTIGDDATDEQMFRDAPAGSYTIKVGSGRSAAHYRLANPEAVRKLLRKL